MAHEVGNVPRPSTQTQYPERVARGRVVISSTLKNALCVFLHNMPGFISDFDAIGGSAAGCVALRNCDSHIAHVEKKCRDERVERAEIIAELAQAAQSLDVAQQEVIEKLSELAPGYAEKVFAGFGMLFGLIAAVAIYLAAPSLALAAGGVWLATYLGQGWAMEREDARDRLKEEFTPQLEIIRSATVRAESAYTIKYIKSHMSEVAAAHFAALLASPRCYPAHDALNDTPPPLQMRLRADTIKSPLCWVLSRIQTGELSIPDEPGRALLCDLLNHEADEALAQQQDSAAGTQANEAIPQNLLSLLKFLKRRPPAINLMLEGNACESKIQAKIEAFEHLVRQHQPVRIDIDEPLASTRDQLHRDTEHAKGRLGVSSQRSGT